MLDEVVEQNSDLLSVFCDRERERKKEKQKIHRRFIELINLATINLSPFSPQHLGTI